MTDIMIDLETMGVRPDEWFAHKALDAAKWQALYLMEVLG